MSINRHRLNSPVDIITTTLGIPEGYKQQCIQEAYKICDGRAQRTNVKALRSSYWMWNETSIYNPLLDRIMGKVNMSFPIEDNQYKYELCNCWAIVYKEGHYTIPHIHAPSNISFVYYLKSNSNSSPLVFDECDFKVYPHDDLLAVFPSYLIHSVPKHYGEDRICIAGNLNLVSEGTDLHKKGTKVT